MKPARINHPPTHRDPDDYDLPRGEWLCLSCTMQKLGTKRSATFEICTRRGIESFNARSLRGRYAATFFNRGEVARLVRDRADNDHVLNYHNNRHPPSSHKSFDDLGGSWDNTVLIYEQ